MTHCQYFLVQYVPVPRQQPRLPIGLILLDASGRLVRQAVSSNWRAVRCLDPRADLRLLKALPEYLDSMLQEQPGMDGSPRQADLVPRLSRMARTGFGAVQISPACGVETEDPAREFDRLFEEHVALQRVHVPRPASRPGSRRWIHSRLQAALRRSPVWPRLNSSVSVEEYTTLGDRFRIDFSYRPNGVTKFLHALSLERDWNQAKVLSFTFLKVRQRMPAALTAVVADRSPQLAAAQSCRRILLDAGIAIHPLGELEGLVDQIQKELGPVIKAGSGLPP